MRLRNKKTGEIVEPYGISCKNMQLSIQFCDEKGNFKFECYSLAELNEEWEDYKEPKKYWYIDYDGRIHKEDHAIEEEYKDMVEIGNHFETREDAEKAVEKLKAWKRLKDKGFRFDNWDLDADDEDVNVLLRSDSYKGNKVYDFAKDLDLLFSGGEE